MVPLFIVIIFCLYCSLVKNIDKVNNLKGLLDNEFEMKDFDETKKILGMEIRRDRKTCFPICLSTYIH